MMTSFDVLEKLAVVPEADYHAASRKGTWLSSHLLADFRRCPEFYHRKVTVGVVEKPSRAYALGRAAHKLILEGEQAFREDYTVSDGPTNPKTGQPYGKLTKAYAEWEVALGKIPGDDLGDEAGVLREGLAGVADVGALEGAELVEEQPDGDGHEGQDAERDGEEDEVAVLEHGGSGGWGVGASAGHPRIR